MCSTSGTSTSTMLVLVLLGSALAGAQGAMGAGAPLSLVPCASPAERLVAALADGTVRDASAALCATLAGPSPAQLVMAPCQPGLAAQAWRLNASASAVQGAGSAPLCFNTQGAVGVPARPVSTWPCSDLAWNSYFFEAAGGRLAANCSAPGRCGAAAAPAAYCVGAAPPGRVLAFSTVVRYWTVETTRTEHLLNNESALHTVAACRALRAAFAQGWPGAAMTWAFSWVALSASDGEYPAIRALVAGYVAEYGDEFTFIPGGYFAPMYNAQAQTSADIHDALALIASAVGGGYRPQAIVAGFLGAQTLAHLAQVEGIHVAQATIFSQFNIDFGDGDGGSPYPYYPSTSHYLRPAQSAGEQVDCVVLDGWTVDLLAARRNGFAGGFNSRMGVGPIETIRNLGPAAGFAEQMHATAAHFDTGAALNGGEAFVSSIWEVSLPINVSYLTAWLAAVRGQWPDARAMTHGAYGLAWRAAHASNDFNYSFVTLGSGLGGSDADKELTMHATAAFRLVLLRNLTETGLGQVIDFTRYDLPAAEPASLTKSWNLMNELNWKTSRGAQDAPRALQDLSAEDLAIIRRWLPGY
jgi:hypothetical protein